MGKISISVRDYSSEIGNMGFPIAETGTDTQADYAALATAVEGLLEAVMLGTIARKAVTIAEDTSLSEPGSPFAQRELGVRVFLAGISSEQTYTITIPTPDLAALTLVDDSDLVVLADGGVMAALVTWLEANLAYPYGAGTESVSVDRAVVVGRNS